MLSKRGPSKILQLDSWTLADRMEQNEGQGITSGGGSQDGTNLVWINSHQRKALNGKEMTRAGDGGLTPGTSIYLGLVVN